MDSRPDGLPEQALVVPEPAGELTPEPTTRPATGKPFAAAVVVSAFLHAIALYYWVERPPVTATTDKPQRMLHINLRASPAAPKPEAANTKTPPVEKPSPPDRSDRAPATETESPTRTQSPPQTPPASAPTNKTLKAKPESSLDLSPPVNDNPATATPDNPRVFNPRLQSKIEKAKAKRLRLDSHEPANNNVWQNADGTTLVKTGSGGCLKARRQQGRGFARDWYMSGCNGQRSSSEKLLRNMQRRIDARRERR